MQASGQGGSGVNVDALTSLKGAKLTAAFVTNGALTIEFLQFSAPIDPSGDKRPAMNTRGCPHLGFMVESVLSEYERLKTLGVNFYAPPVFSTRHGSYSVMLTDPDGIPIELREGPAIPVAD